MKRLLNDRGAKIIVILWYLVGIAGFMIHPLRPLFQQLTSFGMVVAAVLLLYFQEPKNTKSWLVFSCIAVLGFVAELIGVNTQFLFGHYEYGNALGFKLWNTPLTIGLNWLVLIYCIAALAKNIRDHWYFPLIGAFVMVAFDWLMEPVAIAIGMWTWEGGSIPLQNYIDWFLISGFIFLMIRILKVELNNRIAGVLFVMQLVFFLTLNILIRTSLWDF
ncbi:MAG TPA: carotenoid biosynthesis protein [Prolixibacteraceae bacterium]|nr:carotenoid biosynthesis protein [Prolixibacteraceae bacterium]